MALYSSRLTGRELVAEGTLAIRLERPSGFSFQLGQYADLTVLNPPRRDMLGPIRSMSIASAPGADHLEFLMRIRETAFKQAVATMPIGGELLVEGPFDDFHLHVGPRESVLIAGGVGVAPFLSALRDAAATGSALWTTLFYSNRRSEDAAFLEELARYEAEIPGFRLVATMTRMASSSREWKGETERLGPALLGRYLPSLVGPAYYISGSPGLISQMRAELVHAGVPGRDIGIELYAGY